MHLRFAALIPFIFVAACGSSCGASSARSGASAASAENNASGTSATPSPATSAIFLSDRLQARPSDEELRQRLTPEQYRVSCEAGTERPFENPYWDHHEAGIYVDVISGEPLFSSIDKYDSGTGWPSFSRPIDPSHIRTEEDRSLGVQRTELRSRIGNAHLGHVFDDGPGPNGERYCINSASLRFVPAASLQAEGYGEYTRLFPDVAQREVAVLAGGCFWGMEELLRAIPGVIQTEVGYTGGSVPNPTYEDLHTGQSGHAESVRVTFDPTRLSYSDLLERWFFRMHDPTTLNRQGNDVGSQYRSAIFVSNGVQRRTAEEVIARVNQSRRWPNPVTTRIEMASAFTLAESEHQDYLQRNPGGYTCHYMRD